MSDDISEPDHDTGRDQTATGGVDAQALYQLVVSGQATLEDIADWLGSDVMIALGAMFTDPHVTERAFQRWYAAVLEPIGGLDIGRARALYTGQITAEDFCCGLDEDTLDRFCDQYPALQRAYQDHLDARERRRQDEAARARHTGWFGDIPGDRPNGPAR